MSDLPPNCVVDLVTAESGDVVSYNAFYPPVEVNSVETPYVFYSTETVGGAGPQGALGPPGPTGSTGSPAFTTTAGAFDLPALGATVTVTLQDASWVTIGQMVVVQTAGGSLTDAYSLKVTAKTGSQVTLLNIGTSATIPLVSATTAGLMPKLPNTGKGYFCDTGTWALPGNYYGTDTTNSGAYVVTVSNDFVLEAGVVVWITPTNANSGAPTLNVNGTGVLAIRNRANIALSGGELFASKTFGVVYDGTSWRVITPLTRIYVVTNPGTVSIECAGYESVRVYATQTVSGAMALTLQHLAEGTPVAIDLYNGYTAAFNYTIVGTNLAGAAMNTYWIGSNATTGGAAVRIDSATSLTNGNNMLMFGNVFSGQLFFK